MSTVTTIKRGGLTAAVDSMGAQLTSLALDGNEYLLSLIHISEPTRRS